MKKVLITLIVLIVIAAGAYLYVTRAPSAPSTDINNAGETLTATSSGQLYRISNGSQARFDIDEVLNDEPFTAVGTTTQIAGDVIVSKGTTGTTVEIGTITINARTFKTDSERRDGAIARAILKSESAANEFIEFRPTGTVSVASSIGTTPVSFTVPGSLTIAGVTKPATFTVKMAISSGNIIGRATASLKRSDFGLTIPNVPFVASVEDVFSVSADIVAVPVAK